MAFEVELSKSEQELVDAARVFTAEHVTPNAGNWERDRIYPRDTQLEAAARGLGGVLVPKADGGQGASFSAACRVFEELANGCMAFTFSMVVHNNFALSLASNGSANAAVLPVPVGALPSRSWPASSDGIVRAWIGEGVS